MCGCGFECKVCMIDVDFEIGRAYRWWEVVVVVVISLDGIPFCTACVVLLM